MIADVVVIGGGQAGLATAWHLTQQGLRPLVLDAGDRIGHSWQGRWESLTLFTPAEYDSLPGTPFPAPAGTYPGKDAVADYLRDYAETNDLDVELGARVTRLGRHDGGFEIRTADRTLLAPQVVVATGPFQVPAVPAVASGLAGSVHQLHSAAYRDPASLPDGDVLVVGGGNSGFQIAQELAASRQVDLAVGTELPLLPQRVLGRDLFWWLTRSRLMRVSATSRLGRRLQARDDVVIGTDRRRLEQAGVRMRPRVVSTAGRVVRFADDSRLAVGVVVWATGYRTDHSWIDVPGVVVDGRVVHRRGITDVPGLSFVGLPWQHTRGSALLGFVGDDAAYVAAVARRHAASTPVPHPID